MTSGTWAPSTWLITPSSARGFDHRGHEVAATTPGILCQNGGQGGSQVAFSWEGLSSVKEGPPTLDKKLHFFFKKMYSCYNYCPILATKHPEHSKVGYLFQVTQSVC